MGCCYGKLHLSLTQMVFMEFDFEDGISRMNGELRVMMGEL